uniref:RING-CH-type domain-containing protein n=1 Tax=viral metagenome TaxID=1070528 RepID=A0A6C0EIL6_9ZZZZ
MDDTLPIIQTYDCRLCFDADSPHNLIYPCKCAGTSKYVHKNCLNEWRTLADNREAFNKCFECNYTYTFTNEPIHQISWQYKLLKHLSKNLAGFIIINFFIMSLITLFLYVVDINRVMPKILLHAKNTSFINYNNGKHLMSGYILWSSIIYLSVLLIMFVVNFINIRNKTIYIKHYCKQPNALFFVIIVLCGIIFSMDIIIGLFLISFGLQFLIKSHLYSIECIREQNNMEILNYEEDEIYDN